MRVCDYIAQFLVGKGLRRVYGVVAGGTAGINDGWASNRAIEFVALHGESSCGYAAVSESKVTGNLSCVNVGTGCCGTNAVTACLTAWQDSVPVLFISGNVNLSQTIDSNTAKVRNFGVQGADIISVVSSITKYSILVKNKDEIPYIIQKAVHECLDGRPGPVWIDIPTDIQTSEIEISKLSYQLDPFDKEKCPMTQLKVLIEALKVSKRPVFLVGQGAKKAIEEIEFWSQFFEIPIVSTYGPQTFIRSDNYIGVVGTKGCRAANFILHKSDLIIVLGSSLNVSVTGYNYKLFAPEAKVIVIDIDKTQHSKDGIKFDLIPYAVEDVFTQIRPQPHNEYKGRWRKWLDKAIELEEKWPVCLPSYEDDLKGINPYFFLKNLYSHFKDDTVLVADAGGSFYSTCQTFRPKKDQVFATDLNNAAMGYMIPAVIGASFGKRKGEVVGVAGEGGFTFAIQELQSIVHHDLPIKLFVINNGGYNSLRKTQENFFKSRYLGIGPEHGISFPDLSRVASCFGLPYFKIKNNKDLEQLQTLMLIDGPVLCEVVCPEDMSILPTIGSKMEDGKIQSMPLWNMSPFLSEEELNKELEEIKNL